MNPTQRQVLADAYDEGAQAALDLVIEEFENTLRGTWTPRDIVLRLIEAKAEIRSMAKGLERKRG